MNKLIFVLLILYSLLTYSQTPTPANDPNWEKVWGDEFDIGTTPDPVKWNIKDNFDHYGKPTVYLNRPENVSVSNSNLVITVRRDNYSCPEDKKNCWNCAKESEPNPDCPGGDPDYKYKYSSAWIETKSSFNVHYGYIEALIKLPYGYGFWPAFWTFDGDGVVNPNNAAEIDIFEMNGDQPPTTMGTNIHLEYCNSSQYDYNPVTKECPHIPNYQQDITIPSYANVYHLYAIEWDPSKLIWYVDGKVVRNIINPGIVDPVTIILGMGLTWWRMPNVTTPFPSSMLVDYVRVYQLKKDCETEINACNYDLVNHDNQVKKSIAIGGTACSNTVPSGNNVALRASEYVEIKGDFSVPLGAEFYADANNICSICSDVFIQCNYDLNKYKNSIKKIIEIGGDNCVSMISSGKNIELKATDYISLKSGFKASRGSEVKIKIVDCQ